MPSKNRCFISFILKSVHPRLTMLALPGGLFKKNNTKFQSQACWCMSSNPITCEMEAEGSRFQGQSLIHEITSQNNPSCTQNHSPEGTLPQHLQKIHCNSILKGFGPTLKSEKCCSASDDTKRSTEPAVPLTKRGKRY